MYTAREIKPAIILSFAWPSLLFFLFYSVFLCSMSYWGQLAIGFSFIPIGLIGTAVAFYVGFKNNSSYERLWEARRIWGALVNASRTWGVYTVTHIKTDSVITGMNEKELHAKLVHGIIAYVNALRIQLRQKSVWNNSSTTAHTVVRGNSENEPLHLSLTLFFSDREAKQFLSKKNPATHILKAQAALLSEIYQHGGISERLYVQTMALIQEFFNQQGAAERIKNFPFPRQYAYFSKIFVWLFILVLPFGLISEFSKIGADMIWISIPVYIIIAWVFNTMEIVGDTSENPFENAINDIPMTAICRTIEIDLREMLEEKSIPPALTAVDNILM